MAARSYSHAAARAPPRVVAVVVTYNRRDLLLESLAAVLGAEPAPDAVIVVDNASTDGTADDGPRAASPPCGWPRLQRNTGGAGGFAYGLALALADGADLVWLMDDDTVPEPGALRACSTPARSTRAGRPR